MYRLEFLPIARRDMIEIVRYISEELSNPIAAQNLADEMIRKADNLKEFPYINMVHQTFKQLKNEYRKQAVKNYFLFYWVEETPVKLVTIARVIYARCNFDELLDTDNPIP